MLFKHMASCFYTCLEFMMFLSPSSFYTVTHKCWDWLKTLNFFFFLMKTCLTYWRRKCQPTPVFLPVEFHGQRSLKGCSPWGHKESDTTELFSLHFTAWRILTHLDIQKNFANNSSTEWKKNASRWFELLFSSLSFLSSKSIISSLCPGAVIDLKSGFGIPGRSGCVCKLRSADGICRLSTEDTWACVSMHFKKTGEISEWPEIYTNENTETSGQAICQESSMVANYVSKGQINP